jgi:MFS family permease
MAIFSAVTMIGPTLAPIVGGFVSASRLGWRMVFWIQVIVASLSFIPLYFCPETFAPIILLRKAARLRKQGETDVIAPLELEDRSLKTSLKTTLSRPFRMFWYEGIVLLVSLFLGFVYAVFYIFFQSYPLIYSGLQRTSHRLRF